LGRIWAFINLLYHVWITYFGKYVLFSEDKKSFLVYESKYFDLSVETPVLLGR
jgi:hypothetical protein